MKTELSSIDVAAVVSELRELAGSRIEKIYAHTDDEIRLNIYRFSEGRVNLIIKPGSYLFLTDHSRKSPKIPPSFAMMLRKHLMSGRITEVRQYDFDRVVEIVVTRAETTSVLVVELFNPGNIILLDSDRRILLPMKPVTFKGRRIRSGEEYVYPKAQISPIDVTKEELHTLLASSDSNIVRALASNLNMGGKVAEEVCTQAGVDKKITASQVTDEIVASIYDGLAKTFEPVVSHNLKPQVVCKSGADKAQGKAGNIKAEGIEPEADQYIDVMPFDLSEYKDAPRKYFDTFNKALDAYFSPKVMQKSAAAAEVEVKVVESALVRRLRQQEDAIGAFEAKKGNLSAKGEAIYGNYQMVVDVINVITGARDKGYSWKDIKSILKGA
ncbi:MAG: NFACT family protein, partial [Methanosarcinales archaeon]|nr:NFACT family protein [Methanosarcinales archaeon]